MVNHCDASRRFSLWANNYSSKNVRQLSLYLLLIATQSYAFADIITNSIQANIVSYAEFEPHLTHGSVLQQAIATADHTRIYDSEEYSNTYTYTMISYLGTTEAQEHTEAETKYSANPGIIHITSKGRSEQRIYSPYNLHGYVGVNSKMSGGLTFTAPVFYSVLSTGHSITECESGGICQHPPSDPLDSYVTSYDSYREGVSQYVGINHDYRANSNVYVGPNTTRNPGNREGVLSTFLRHDTIIVYGDGATQNNAIKSIQTSDDELSATMGSVIGHGLFGGIKLATSPAILYNAAGTMRWYDPIASNGFLYDMVSDNLFTDILNFPIGYSGTFNVYAEGQLLGTFSSGDHVNFSEHLGHSVKNFAITGIDPYDPLFNNGFPLQLAFDAEYVDFQQQALYINSVPEPETYTMMLAGIGLMGFFTIRSRRQFS